MVNYEGFSLSGRTEDPPGEVIKKLDSGKPSQADLQV
jgi:hypothetical protein